MYCKDCKKWDKSDGECNEAYWEDRYIKVKGDDFVFFTDAHDNSGLYACVKTGPLFGCIKFKAKK